MMMMFHSTPKSFFRLAFCFARIKRNSQWIYSNKGEEMAHARKGKIYVCSHTGSDFYNCTIRMHKTLQSSHLVLSQLPKETYQLMKSIAQKTRDVAPREGAQTQAIEVKNQYGEIVKYNKQEAKERDFQRIFQSSKYLEMSQQIERINQSNNDRDNKLLKKQQEELGKFMEYSSIKEKLDTFRKENGFPRVLDLVENVERIKVLRDGGVSIFCFVEENQPSSTRVLFNYLEQNAIPYEVLPASNHIINLLASSGFPADRFAIEYFPHPIAATLEKRRPMKMTIGMVFEKKYLLSTVQALKKIYGDDHMAYLQSEEGKMIFRGRINDFQNGLVLEVGGKIMRMAIAPYISTFNQGLKEQRNKVSRLYGQAMSNHTHEVRMQFINMQLKQLLKRKDSRKVLINSMIQQLTARVGKEKTKIIAAQVLGLKPQQAEILVSRAQSQQVMDHLGLSQYQQARKK